MDRPPPKLFNCCSWKRFASIPNKLPQPGNPSILLVNILHSTRGSTVTISEISGLNGHLLIALNGQMVGYSAQRTDKRWGRKILEWRPRIRSWHFSISRLLARWNFIIKIHAYKNKWWYSVKNQHEIIRVGRRLITKLKNNNFLI